MTRSLIGLLKRCGWLFRVLNQKHFFWSILPGIFTLHKIAALTFGFKTILYYKLSAKTISLWALKARFLKFVDLKLPKLRFVKITKRAYRSGPLLCISTEKDREKTTETSPEESNDTYNFIWMVKLILMAKKALKTRSYHLGRFDL